MRLDTLLIQKFGNSAIGHNRVMQNLNEIMLYLLLVCICEKKLIDQGMFSNKDEIKLLRPDQEITSWSINFLNIFDIKQNRGIFKILFN